jgi:ABC-type Na+ transport system ATPase subunit NatA
MNNQVSEIEFVAVSKEFRTGLVKKKTAVDNISFSIGRGDVVGILGANGSGKSTCLKMILGFLQPTHGAFRIAAAGAQFGILNRRWGVPLIDGGTQRLPRIVGLGNALYLIETGALVGAQHALRMGLVDEVVPHAMLSKRTTEIAEAIASKSAVAVRLAKAAVKASARLPLDQGLRYEQQLFTLAIASDDTEEGIRAFREKREPNWKDR